jgi:hypothetical protein
VTKKAKSQSRIYCPGDPELALIGKGESLLESMAFPFHLKGKVCKLCGKPSADHIVVIGKNK